MDRKLLEWCASVNAKQAVVCARSVDPEYVASLGPYRKFADYTRDFDFAMAHVALCYSSALDDLTRLANRLRGPDATL